MDGRATARHLHGIIERTVRCYTAKVSAESAGAVASTMFLESLPTRQSGRLAQPDGGAGTPAGRGCHLQGRSAPPSWTTPEGRGLTHALTHTAPTDLTVAAALVRKAYSKRRRSCLWSKPVNLRTWRLVSDPIAMVQALAELRYGVLVHTRENSVKYGLNFNQTPYARPWGFWPQKDQRGVFISGHYRILLATPRAMSSSV